MLYNFGIHSFVGFYLKFWSYSRSNRRKRNRAGRRLASLPPTGPRLPRSLPRGSAHPKRAWELVRSPWRALCAPRRALPTPPAVRRAHTARVWVLPLAIPCGCESQWPLPIKGRLSPSRACTLCQPKRVPPHAISTPPPSSDTHSRPRPSYHPIVSPRTP
jgi:hypothetical protein